MSTRWKNVKDIPAIAPLANQIAKPETRRDNVIIPKGFHVKRLPARIANGAYKARGGMAGAPTGGNGISIVPAAFIR